MPAAVCAVDARVFPVSGACSPANRANYRSVRSRQTSGKSIGEANAAVTRKTGKPRLLNRGIRSPLDQI